MKKHKISDEKMLKTLEAYQAVKKHISKTGYTSGIIICTSCSGNLHYIQSEINGDIWGSCKCGISWVQ